MNNYKDLHKSICYSCNNNTHFITDCPLLSPINRKFLLLKNNFSKPQIRKTFTRRINKLARYYIPKNDSEPPVSDEFDHLENSNSQEFSSQIIDQNFQTLNKEDDDSAIHQKSPTPLLKNASKMLKKEPNITIEEKKNENNKFIDEYDHQIENKNFSQKEFCGNEENLNHERQDLDLHQKSFKLHVYSTSKKQPSTIQENEENEEYISFMKKSLDINAIHLFDKTKTHKYQNWKSKNMNSINSITKNTKTTSIMRSEGSSSLHKINISTTEELTEIFYLFDKMNNYQKYFPDDNFLNVIEKFNKKNLHKIYKLRKGLALKPLISPSRLAGVNKKFQSIFNKVSKKGRNFGKNPQKSLKNSDD